MRRTIIILLCGILFLLPKLSNAAFHGVAGPYLVSTENFSDFSSFTVEGYMGSGGGLIVPSVLVGTFFFDSEPYERSFERSVTSIGDHAFHDELSLTSVTISSNVTRIGAGAFYGCANMAQVTIPSSVTDIGDGAFQASGLTSVTIPDSVTRLGIQIFDMCSNLVSVEMGKYVTDIGEEAFSDCSSLAYVKIPNTVTNMSSFSFSCCVFTNITIPASVISIGVAPVTLCRNLVSIDVDKNNAHYCSVDGVLLNKIQTTLVQYPGGKAGNYKNLNSVTTIGGGAFAFCGLDSVTFSSSVTNIEDYAFYSCTNLPGIFFEDNAPNAGSNVFLDADNTTIYYLSGTTGWESTFCDRPTALWLTVVEGTAERSYTNLPIVTITADAPGDGRLFDRWTGATQSVADVTSPVTTVTLSPQAISVTATYTYELTVNEGVGSGFYSNGIPVTIEANAPGAGRLFDRWVGDTQYLASVTSLATTVTMPAQAITLSATYKSKYYVQPKLAAWDFYGLSATPNPVTATARVHTVDSAPVLSKVGLGAGGYTNCFFGGQLTNSTLDEAVSANKYFSFSLSNSTPVIVTNVAMCIKRFSQFAPTSFTLRVSSDAGFGTYTDSVFQTEADVNVHIWSATNLSVSGTSVYFRIYSYGCASSTNTAIAGFAGTTNNSASPANSGLNGTMYDLIVYGQSDLNLNGLPDSWERKYFGSISNVDPDAICANGINTVREAYIGGFSPADPYGALKIQEIRSMGTNKTLSWNAAAGHVYSVHWTTNLMTGFQCLESNIPWTRGSFTNSAVVPCGYYKIDVRLEE